MLGWGMDGSCGKPSKESGSTLMTRNESLRGFWYLIATQFQGAFSDNAYKNIVTLVAVSTAVTPHQESQRVSLAGALFILPFLLFSMYGGFLADRFSKRSVTIY